MTDSPRSLSDFHDIPQSALTASHLAADHDVAARIARGHNLLRRVVTDQIGVTRLAADMAGWSAQTRAALAERFVAQDVASAYGAVVEPFVVPSAQGQVEGQVDLLHKQLRHQVEWLERLRLTIPDRAQPPGSERLPRQHRGTPRPAAVLATTASGVAAAVVGAVARATGNLPIVVEDQPGERHSIVSVASVSMPEEAIAVVVLEPAPDQPTMPSATSLLALGFAAGAVGLDRVLAVNAPGIEDLIDLADVATIAMDADESWRQRLGEWLADHERARAAVVSPFSRS